MGRLMSENFGLRQEIFGRDVIGEENILMVNLVRANGGEPQSLLH